MWYELLLRAPYFDYICSDKFTVDSPIFKAYTEQVVGGIMLGNLITRFEKEKQKPALEMTIGIPEHEICREYLTICKFERIDFFEFFHSADRLYRNAQYDKLSPEELAVRIMYPFGSRMGGSFEKEFARSGLLKTLLLLLKGHCSKT